jgi:hypothetical protein
VVVILFVVGSEDKTEPTLTIPAVDDVAAGRSAHPLCFKNLFDEPDATAGTNPTEPLADAVQFLKTGTFT